MKKIRSSWLLLMLMTGVLLFATACSSDDNVVDFTKLDWKETVSTPKWLHGSWEVEFKYDSEENNDIILTFESNDLRLETFSEGTTDLNFTLSDGVKLADAKIAVVTNTDKAFEFKVQFIDPFEDYLSMIDIKLTYKDKNTVDALVDGLDATLKRRN